MCAPRALRFFVADLGNRAAVRLYDALHNRQSQTHALGLFGIERLEDARPVLLGQARPVIDKVHPHNRRGKLRSRQVSDGLLCCERTLHRELSALGLEVNRVLD